MANRPAERPNRDKKSRATEGENKPPIAWVDEAAPRSKRRRSNDRRDQRRSSARRRITAATSPRRSGFQNKCRMPLDTRSSTE